MCSRYTSAMVHPSLYPPYVWGGGALCPAPCAASTRRSLTGVRVPWCRQLSLSALGPGPACACTRGPLKLAGEGWLSAVQRLAFRAQSATQDGRAARLACTHLLPILWLLPVSREVPLLSGCWLGHSMRQVEGAAAKLRRSMPAWGVIDGACNSKRS